MNQPQTLHPVERCLLRAVSAWLLAVTAVDLLPLSSGLLTTALMMVTCYIAFSIIPLLLHRATPDVPILISTLLVTAFTHVAQNSDFYFCLTVLVCLLLVGGILFANGRLSKTAPNLSWRVTKRWIAGLAVLMFAFLAGLTALRYLQYYSPNFDFGIFSNMFHHMREDLSQTVSCERDAVMSHFDVHISPIYYLMLPFYAVFPSPVTLLVVQAALIACGVIPLCRLARKRGVRPFLILLLAVAYLAYPAFSGGCFYDLHENKFLPLLLLSTVCCYESGRFPLTFLFAGLTLLVKEDAPVYVAVLGLYLALDRRDWKRGATLFLGAVAYFIFALTLLESFGTGAMTWRYENISKDGLIGVLIAVFAEPMRVIAECLTAEKLVFVLQMLLPLLFLPLITKRPARLLLLIPLILVNLMTDYQYQYSVRFQYTYGSGALLFYAAVLNLTDLPEHIGYQTLCGAAMASLLLFTSVDLPYTWLVPSYIQNAETRETISDALTLIPADASVAADTFLVAHLAKRDLIFEYPSKNKTEYLVFDLRSGDDDAKARKLASAERKGYQLLTKTENVIAVYRRAELEVQP